VQAAGVVQVEQAWCRGGWVGKEVKRLGSEGQCNDARSKLRQVQQEESVAASLHPSCICTGVSDSLPALLMKRNASPAASLILRPDRSTMLTLLPATVSGARRGGRE